METIESILQNIHQRNRDSRAEASDLSARLQTLTLSGEPDALLVFERELEERYRGLLTESKQNPESSGADGGEASSENS